MTLIGWAGATLGPTGPSSSLFGRVDGHAGLFGITIATTVLVAGLVAVFGAWLFLGLVLRAGASLRPLIAIAIAWSVPLLLGPPLYSRDVYSYAALGRMTIAHLNPYVVGPSALGHSQFVTGVSSAWTHTPSPYGPGFIALCGSLARIAGPSVTTAVLLLRLVEVAGLALAAACLPRLAGRAHKDPGRAIWLAICNPFVLVHCIGGAHNEAIMIGLVLAGLALADADHHALGVLCCVAAASIKSPAGIAAAFVILDAARNAAPRQRVVTMARLGALGAGAFAALTWLTGLGYGWLNALSVPGTNRLLLTPTTLVAQLTSDVIAHDTLVLTATRTVGWLLIGAATVHLLIRRRSMGVTRACGLALAAIVVFGPILLPWYALWSILLVAGAGRRIERGVAIFASILLMLTVQPSGSAMPDLWLIATVLCLAVTILVMGAPSIRRWIREDLAVALDHYRLLDHEGRMLDIPRRALARRAPARQVATRAPS